MTEAYQDKRALKKIDNELKIQQLWYITLKLVIGVGEGVRVVLIILNKNTLFYINSFLVPWPKLRLKRKGNTIIPVSDLY